MITKWSYDVLLYAALFASIPGKALWTKKKRRGCKVVVLRRAATAVDLERYLRCARNSLALYTSGRRSLDTKKLSDSEQRAGMIYML